MIRSARTGPLRGDHPAAVGGFPPTWLVRRSEPDRRVPGMAGFVVDNRGIVRAVSDYFKECVRSNFL
jgi:hypothetical protein